MINYPYPVQHRTLSPQKMPILVQPSYQQPVYNAHQYYQAPMQPAYNLPRPQTPPSLESKFYSTNTGSSYPQNSSIFQNTSQGINTIALKPKSAYQFQSQNNLSSQLNGRYQMNTRPNVNYINEGARVRNNYFNDQYLNGGRQPDSNRGSNIYNQNYPQQIQSYGPQQGLLETNQQNNEFNHIQLYYQSELQLEFIGTTTYNQIFKTNAFSQQSQDLLLKSQLQRYGVQVFNDKLFLFVADLQPENIQWQVIQHSTEITQFIEQFQAQVNFLQKNAQSKGNTGHQIVGIFNQLKLISNNRQKHIHQRFIKKSRKNQQVNIRRPWNQQQVALLTRFINLALNHPYLKKSVPLLTLINHCVPVHLWNLKIYQQVQIYNDPNLFTRIFKNEEQLSKYLTVSGDGIMISTKNPMQTLVTRMVPFTNQFQFSSYIEDDGDLFFKISSCSTENVQVNLKQDYVRALNFYIGMKRALVDSMHNKKNRFNSFSVPRQFCSSKLYNDGQGYFKDVCDQLLKARRQVLITDWWMTPYINLIRKPMTDQQIQAKLRNPRQMKRQFQKYMLGNVLNKIARRGVKIYIILFRQPLNLISTDSYQCQIYLQSLGPNIKVRRHPITPQLWSHHQKCVVIDQRVGFMGGIDLCYGRFDNSEHHLTNHNHLWDGGDYVNQRIKSYVPGTTQTRETPIDEHKQPRMPWHDIAIQIRGDTVIDLARHFIQYWYFVDSERIKDPYNHFRNIQRRLDRALHYNDPEMSDSDNDENGCNMNRVKTSTRMFLTGTQNRLRELLIQVRQGRVKGTQQLQLCRSASPWSIGAQHFQQSIHNAYQTLISESEHLIYIENQFFMGNRNNIVNRLAERIEKAHLRKQNFKVIVVMPLLPGFQGEITDVKNTPLRIQVQNQFQSINRGKQSLHYKLKHLTNFNINDYIFFFGLRGHAVINNQPVTQIIYVHSKLMIVDDKRAIIGSANINDRSMSGDRDSQLAVVIQQDNGKIKDPLPRRQQIFDLRCRIFEEHFGLTKEETALSNDPVIWQKMINTAKTNTLIYRQLFGCYPDDTITVCAQVEERKIQGKTERYYELAPQIRAHAVQFPLHFLEDQDLSFQLTDKQRILGMDAFL